MSEDRFFAHSFSDEIRNFPFDVYSAAIAKIAAKLMHDESRGHSIYTGISGVSYALLRLLSSSKIQFPLQVETERLTKQNVWERALRNIRFSMEAMRERSEKHHGWSVYCGHAGVYCTSAMVFLKASKAEEWTPLENTNRLEEESRRAFRKFTNLSVLVNSFSIEQRGIPADELLYGRSGYLLAVLTLRRFGLSQELPIREIIQAILDSGRYQSYIVQHPSPLYYEYPPGDRAQPYIGCGHGIMGILYTLMQFLEDLRELEALPLIHDALNFVLTLECDQTGTRNVPQGFYPTVSFVGDHYHQRRHHQSMPLVHWCHGSTGAVFLFAKAFEVFQDERFLNAAIRAGEVVWERGLLKKGPGLCHGVAGNGYALLALFRITHEQKYFMRASCFGEFMMSTVFQTARVPDNPWSLFEGWAGALCFLLDMLDPQQSSFPFFEF